MTPYLSKLCLIGLTGLCFFVPGKARSAPLVNETFEMLDNGPIAGQPGWFLSSGGNTNLAQVVEDATEAYSSPKYLNLVGTNGSSASVLRAFPTPNTLTDTTNNHLQFYFRADNAQEGSKTQLYFTLYGNSGAGRIIESAINFATSRISITTNAAAGSYNTVVNLSSALETDKWYLLDVALTPSESTFQLSIAEAATSSSLLSGEFAFQNTSLDFDRLHGIQFFTNNNGRLDWQIDSILVDSAIPEPGAAALLLPVVAGSVVFWYRRKQ